MSSSSLKSNIVLNDQCFSQSTLLIPDNLFEFYCSQCKRHGSRRNYLSFVIKTFAPDLHTYKEFLNKKLSKKWKTHYQKQNLCLHRCNFMPSPSDWEDLRHVATGLGVSMCYLFVFLLKIDAGLVPEKPSAPKCKASIYWNSLRQMVGQLLRLPNCSKLRRILSQKKEILHRKYKIRQNHL